MRTQPGDTTAYCAIEISWERLPINTGKLGVEVLCAGLSTLDYVYNRSNGLR